MSNLSECLQDIGASHRDYDVNVVDDEQRLVGCLIWEEGEIVSHVHKLPQMCLLQIQKTNAKYEDMVS